MEEVLLICCIILMLLVGYFSCKKLDRFFGKNAQAHVQAAANKPALHIAFSNAAVVEAVIPILNNLINSHHGLAISLYIGTPATLLKSLHAGIIDIAFLDQQVDVETSSKYDMLCITLGQNAVYAEQNSTLLTPLDNSDALQHILWQKGACCGIADDLIRLLAIEAKLQHCDHAQLAV